jgi:nucleoside-diphosphate-sugar epimerase
VNLDATLNLLEMLRDPDRPPRVIFASSIAVFGPPLPDLIDDDTTPLPTMNYGAQKQMIEVAVEQFSARGWIDGLAIRLPGIVARTDADVRLKSAFLNTMFYDFREGRNIVLPVGPDGTTWLISAPACIEAFLHAAHLSPDRLARRRAFTLPAQRTTIADLIDALRERFPTSATVISYAPDPALEAQFARQPLLTTMIADALGFRHDGSLAALVEQAMKHQGVTL